MVVAAAGVSYYCQQRKETAHDAMEPADWKLMIRSNHPLLQCLGHLLPHLRRSTGATRRSPWHGAKVNVDERFAEDAKKSFRVSGKVDDVKKKVSQLTNASAGPTSGVYD